MINIIEESWSNLWCVRDKNLVHHTVTKSIYDYIEDLKSINKTQEKAIRNLCDKLVNPPYDEHLENTVKKRTQFLSDELNRLKRLLEKEKIFSDYLLERLTNKD